MISKLAYHISNQGNVYGIDVSKTSVQISCRKNKVHIVEGNVEIMQLCVEDMPFLSDIFDEVFAVQTHR